MSQKHKTWVCTICSQSFTRNSSAKRHDINLHEGNADYVRYIDYEIGRIQGKYYQNDPALYKKKSYNYNNLTTNKQSLNISSERTKLSLDDHKYFNLNSFSHSNNDESSQTASFFDKPKEIMELVDQINTIGKNVWPTYLMNQAIIWLLSPYLFNSPNPKTTVEKYLNDFKEITERKRLSNLFKS
ncbi:MAG TPA: hypothetical protein VF222_08340 [Nitrososphaeraceae archaeon]